MRSLVLRMAGPSPPDATPNGKRREHHDSFGDGRPRRVATWAAVIGPILSQLLGGAVIIYEVVTNINSPAALGVGLTLAVGGKFATVLSELLKPTR